MPTYISLLRGINVSGQKKIKMIELKDLYQSLGFENVQTYIQSGNVIFSSKIKSKKNITQLIEKNIKKTWGYEVSVILKNNQDLKKIVKGNPFPKADTTKLYVTLFETKPKNIATEEIEKKQDKTEKIFITPTEIYIFCPNGYGKTKLTNTFLEKKTGVVATTRNWKTINNLINLSEKQK